METQDIQNTQEAELNDKMSNSLDDYYCDDYDGDDGNDEYEQNNTQDLIKCGNCGNRWDGYAQCNCYQLEYYRIYDHDEQDLEKQDLENPEHKTAFEKSRAKNISENTVNDSENNEDTFTKVNSEDINNEN
jgi:hypothetical protein